MMNYRKPTVMLSEETYEGIYMASGDPPVNKFGGNFSIRYLGSGRYYITFYQEGPFEVTIWRTAGSEKIGTVEGDTSKNMVAKKDAAGDSITLTGNAKFSIYQTSVQCQFTLRPDGCLTLQLT